MTILCLVNYKRVKYVLLLIINLLVTINLIVVFQNNPVMITDLLSVLQNLLTFTSEGNPGILKIVGLILISTIGTIPYLILIVVNTHVSERSFSLKSVARDIQNRENRPSIKGFVFILLTLFPFFIIWVLLSANNPFSRTNNIILYINLLLASAYISGMNTAKSIPLDAAKNVDISRFTTFVRPLIALNGLLVIFSIAFQLNLSTVIVLPEIVLGFLIDLPSIRISSDLLFLFLGVLLPILEIIYRDILAAKESKRRKLVAGIFMTIVASLVAGLAFVIVLPVTFQINDYASVYLFSIGMWSYAFLTNFIVEVIPN